MGRRIVGTQAEKSHGKITRQRPVSRLTYGNSQYLFLAEKRDRIALDLHAAKGSQVLICFVYKRLHKTGMFVRRPPISLFRSLDSPFCMVQKTSTLDQWQVRGHWFLAYIHLERTRDLFSNMKERHQYGDRRFLVWAGIMLIDSHTHPWIWHSSVTAVKYRNDIMELHVRLSVVQLALLLFKRTTTRVLIRFIWLTNFRKVSTFGGWIGQPDRQT